MWGAGIKPNIDEILTMRPPPGPACAGRTALVIRMTPKTLISKSRRDWAIEFSSLAPASPMPRCSPGRRSAWNCAIHRIDCGGDGFILGDIKLDEGPRLGCVRVPRCCGWCLRRGNPASRRDRAANLPRPELAPVTSATRLGCCHANVFLRCAGSARRRFRTASPRSVGPRASRPPIHRAEAPVRRSSRVPSWSRRRKFPIHALIPLDVGLHDALDPPGGLLAFLHPLLPLRAMWSMTTRMPLVYQLAADVEVGRQCFVEDSDDIEARQPGAFVVIGDAGREFCASLRR